VTAPIEETAQGRKSLIDVRNLRVIETLADCQWRTTKQARALLASLNVAIPIRKTRSAEDTLPQLLSALRQGKFANYVADRRIVDQTRWFRVRNISKTDLLPYERSGLEIKDFVDGATALVLEAKELTNQSPYTISPKAIHHKLILLGRLIDGLRREVDTK
jgi:hypothetical protein